MVEDADLDRVAREHSVKMKDARTVGHDVGDGDVSDRLNAASITFRVPGENVASAATLVRAHRALWQSPSHRTNLLEARFKRIGIGIERTDDGRVWVTELFTD
ncbi:MAG: CAP domain-containing protein [Polyangiaceae bacterium]